MYTRSTPVAEAIANRQWWVLDLEGQTLGRAATKIAHVLRGKHKPSFTPHVDDGDYIVVINAEKVHLTGNKWAGKTYYRHTGYLSGLREITAEKLRDREPEALIRKAVKGMLPRGPLGRAQLKKLKIHVGPMPAHGYAAQKPQPLAV